MIFDRVELAKPHEYGWPAAPYHANIREEPGNTLLSGGYAPDSAKAEGSSIVDEPGEG